MTESIKFSLPMLVKALPVSRVRRNHALEHATLQILSAKYPHLRMAGYSDPGGFWVIGNITTEELQLAAEEAQTRLKNGESWLAIHPNCGTNFAASGVVAGAAAWLAMLGVGHGFRRKWDRLPLVISAVTVALIFAQPIGPYLQQHYTTEADLGELKVTGIMRYADRTPITHRVMTKG